MPKTFWQWLPQAAMAAFGLGMIIPHMGIDADAMRNLAGRGLTVSGAATIAYAVWQTVQGHAS